MKKLLHLLGFHNYVKEVFPHINPHLTTATRKCICGKKQILNLFGKWVTPRKS